MNRAWLWRASALGLFALGGCGQKGTLYLPDESIQTPVEIRQAPAGPPAAAAPAATPAADSGGTTGAPASSPSAVPEPQAEAPSKARKPSATAPR